MLHYLDDYIMFGAPESGECQEALDIALQVCGRLGVPITMNMTEGPNTTILFRGIEIDTMRMEVRLPQAKLGQLKEEIRRWSGRTHSTKKQLQSLIGKLQHACCVVKPGRSFLRRMLDLMVAIKKPEDLTKGFGQWAAFLPSWNGVSMMAGVIPSEVAGSITSDASGSWGCGAFLSRGEWFQLELEGGAHHSQGAPPYSDWRGDMGRAVAGKSCKMLV